MSRKRYRNQAVTVDKNNSRGRSGSHENRKSEKTEQKNPENMPATARQRDLLREAIRKGWLYPNPFACEYAKWKNLTSGDAEKLLASLPPERLGSLEREMNAVNQKFSCKDLGRSLGRNIEDMMNHLGRTIDGGIS